MSFQEEQERGNKQMKILLILSVAIIIILIYLLYQFHKEILDYRRFTCELNDLVSEKNKLLKHISYRCDSLSQNQYYGNPGIGFRSIKELAEKNTRCQQQNKHLV